MKIVVASHSSAWTADATMPSIPLSTEATGPHTWTWTLKWTTFSAHGTVHTPGNNWDASVAASQGGGTLSVTATAANGTASTTLNITGTNPTVAQLTAFLQAQPKITPPIAGVLTKIFAAESNARNFLSNGEPIVSFDKGYGLCQLSTPAPTREFSARALVLAAAANPHLLHQARKLCAQRRTRTRRVQVGRPNPPPHHPLALRARHDENARHLAHPRRRGTRPVVRMHYPYQREQLDQDPAS